MGSQMNARTILMYGHDVLLADTRQMVLDKAGFDVCAARSEAELKSYRANTATACRLLLVCHTVPPAEDPMIEEMAKELHSSLYRLVEGTTPRELIREVSQLLA
jgi:hypothetical protein